MSLFARRNNLHQYGNISDISLGDYNPGDAPGLTVGNKVTSFRLASNKDIIIEMEAKRKLNKVKLHYFRGLNVTFSENAQMVELSDCDHVKDISALKNVPYVKIATCSEIEDFSCLGSQHYLELEELISLKLKTFRGLATFLS
jgi:hypothetical protein